MSERSGIYIKALAVLISVLFVPSHGIESRSVNLALETSFLFDPKDMKQNATFINKVQSVLDKLKTVLDPSPPVFRQSDNVATPTFESEKSIFTKFLSQIGSQLIHFEDDEIRLFAEDLKYAVNKLARKEEFKQICEDARLIAFILNSVEVWAKTEPVVLKLEIAKFILSVDTNAVIELFRVLNRVFETADELKFKKLTKKFNKSVKQSDYKKFLYKTIDFIVFERFKKLNFFFRHVISAELRKFTDYVVRNFKERTVLKNTENNGRRFNVENNDTVEQNQNKSSEKTPSFNVGNEKLKLKNDKKNPTSDVDKLVKNKENLTETNDNIMHVTDDGNIRFGKENNILIDKDLNMNVETSANGISLKIN